MELPDTLDLLKLDKQGKLKNGFYRDCGIYVHSDSQPNQETAKALIEKSEIRLNFHLPIINLS